MTLSYWRGEHHVTAFCRVSYAHKRLFRPQNETLNTKYRIKYGRNFSSEGSGFAVIANTANWHLSLGTGDGNTIKIRFLLKAKSIYNFRQIVLATVQRYVSWEGWLWVEHGMCLKGWLTYPTPKRNYPYPGTATHQAQSNTSMSVVLHVLERRQMKVDTNSPRMLRPWLLASDFVVKVVKLTATTRC